MQTNTTVFHYSPNQAIMPKAKNTEGKLTGDRLFLAILLSFLVMSVAVLMAVQIASATGLVWLGFLPLCLGWLLLYPAFKRLEN